MLDTIRRNMAIALMPEKKQKGKVLNLSSFSYPGQPVYTDLSVKKATREGYKLSLYVYRAIRTIVQAGSGIPWVVLDKNGQTIENHPFELLMKRPNPELSGQDLMEFTIAHLKLVGNALWQPLITGRDIKELWIVMPDLVRPIVADVKGEWIKGYEVTEPSGGQYVVSPSTFIHFMQFDPGNPYWGVGDLLAAARTVDTDNEAQDTQKVSMQNRGIPSGVFEHEAELTQEQFEEQNRRVQEIFLEKTKRRAPWVLGAGAKWQQMSMTPVEMDYIASRLQNKRDVAAAFGISPIFLGDLEQSSYNNMVEARKALYQDCVIPLLDDIESTLNLKLAPLYGDIHITYDLSNVAALREDFGKKVEQAYRLWSMGVPFVQVNEQLELGFSEFSGWDMGYLPFNLMPAGSTAQPKMLNKSINLDTEEQKSTHWKRQDRHRIAYWGVVQKKIEPLYNSESEAIIKSLKGKPKNELVDAAKGAIDSGKDKWEKVMVAVSTSLVEDFGNETYSDIEDKSAKQFSPFSQAARMWIAKHVAENVTSILDTNLLEAKVVIMKGVADNLTVPQIGRQLKQFYSDRSPYKAMRVARTEVTQSASFGNLEAARQSSVVKTKTWLSSRDDRVRDSHIAIDGETVDLNDNFSNGCSAPGIGGDPAETIQCRCVLMFGTR